MCVCVYLTVACALKFFVSTAFTNLGALFCGEETERNPLFKRDFVSHIKESRNLLRVRLARVGFVRGSNLGGSLGKNMQGNPQSFKIYQKPADSLAIARPSRVTIWGNEVYPKVIESIPLGASYTSHTTEF